MTPFTAQAHVRSRAYSTFHQGLLHENNFEDYALKHLYSQEHTKQLLADWGWSQLEIKVGMNYLTIDVFEKVVWIHIPGYIEKKNEKIKIRGISRFVSKGDYVDILIKRCWSKADPYKLSQGAEWNEFIAQGNTGDFYNLNTYGDCVTCSCHAYLGTVKAFDQDQYALKILIKNPKVEGQVPDKHIFAVWKYLGVDSYRQYQWAWNNRKESYLAQNSGYSVWYLNSEEIYLSSKNLT